jgi:tRNA modification GTPase
METIAAISTPPGRGGVGIVRLSGPAALAIAHTMTRVKPEPRRAYYTPFLESDNTMIDEGILLYFQAPHSFTGEDVVELQGHGGPVVLNTLLARALECGARAARPGEFSERAFLNDKVDLTQAEAIADLINAETSQAARSAMRSLEGEFSKLIHTLVEDVIKVRVYVEAAIDFPEEEIDFLTDSSILEESNSIKASLDLILHTAEQGVLLQEGISVVIAGPPNAGKSSLLNAFCQRESAIVTEVAGTTRDVLREKIQLKGVPLHIIDTAGLRDSKDIVEQEGIRRAHTELSKADIILFVFDVNESTDETVAAFIKQVLSLVDDATPVMQVMNKMDLYEGEYHSKQENTISVSVKKKTGLDTLTDSLLSKVGFKEKDHGNFSARQRHVDALKRARHFVESGIHQLEKHNAGELLAEDFRQAQQCLNEITGEFTSDDLLGEIFSSFCIGK